MHGPEERVIEQPGGDGERRRRPVDDAAGCEVRPTAGRQVAITVSPTSRSVRRFVGTRWPVYARTNRSQASGASRPATYTARNSATAASTRISGPWPPSPVNSSTTRNTTEPSNMPESARQYAAKEAVPGKDSRRYVRTPTPANAMPTNSIDPQTTARSGETIGPW
jgi:hypothetical protein